MAREEFESTRHGTTTLIGNLDVVSGEMIAPSIGPTRTEVDFVRHIEQTVAADPAGEWVSVVDTLNIHWSTGLVRWVAQACGLDEPLGGKRQGRHPPEPGLPPGVFVGPVPPHPLRLPVQAQFVAEPD